MQAQYSRVLIVGNGFDLAHGMPTKYTDFLYFVSLSLRFYNKLIIKIEEIKSKEVGL